MNQRPRIGIMPVYDKKENVWWMLYPYMTAVEQAGGVPFMFPQTVDEEVIDSLLAMSDGLLFPGGQDIDPARYGQERKPCCGETLEALDQMESLVFSSALELGKPMLATCRGVQLFNVLCGGTLYQDLTEEYPGALNHDQKPPYCEPVHSVTVKSGGLLHQITGTETLRVNSFHHQAVARIADCFTVEAEAADGLIEAIRRKDRPFVLGVQWHPEWLVETDEMSRRIFQAFLEAC